MRTNRIFRLAGAMTAPLLVTGALIAQTGVASADVAGNSGHHGTLYVAPWAKAQHSDRSCGSAAFRSIEAAVRAAPAWGTVVVCPGTYHEQVVLSKPVSLVGHRAIIDENGVTPAFTVTIPGIGMATIYAAVIITSSHVTFGGFTVRNAQGEGPRDILTPDTLASFAALAHEHPLIGRCRLTGDDRPIKISDFLSRPHFHRSGLYAEVFRHLRIEYQMAISLPSPRGQVIGIAFNRARNDFSEDDRALLNILRCPLSTALERARERQRAREHLAAANPSVLGGLTDREVDVLRLAALGRTNTAIAHALDVSPRTVAKHLQHIYRKLNVTSRASAVFTALAS